MDAKLLTPENGFEKETVVAVDLGDFEGYELFELIRETSYPKIKAIRPLTGWIAIWNHAPDWATHLTALIEEGKVLFPCWHEHGSNTISDGMIEAERPWWAK